MIQPQMAAPRYDRRNNRHTATTSSMAIPVQASGMEQNSGSKSLRVRNSAVSPKSSGVSFWHAVMRKKSPRPIRRSESRIPVALRFLITAGIIQ